MKRKKMFSIFCSTLFLLCLSATAFTSENWSLKPYPEKIFKMMQEGNERFASGKATHPHADLKRLKLAGSENQGKHAYATVISCSDSRVPVEMIFDAGVMDLFVIRVAGNVCDTDETGSIEYGLAHVNTPVLVVLGHSQCGAVTAVTNSEQGKKLELEKNIPQLVDNIGPAVKKAMASHKDLKGEAVVPYAIEENVYQSIEDLYMKSAAVRELVKQKKVKVVGAIYDVGTGLVKWLPSEKTDSVLKMVEESPNKETKILAE